LRTKLDKENYAVLATFETAPLATIEAQAPGQRAVQLEPVALLGNGEKLVRNQT
jgi:hypothetical protein